MFGDSFGGSGKIHLLEGDTDVIYDFKITKSSSAISNDGFLPYGVDATSVDISVIDSTAVQVNSYTISNNIVRAILSYVSPAKSSLLFKLYLNNGSIKNAIFDRVFTVAATP
jgi:hypothetical protein